MKIYVLRFSKSADKEFGKLPRDVQRRIGRSLDRLTVDPRRQGNVRPMVGSTSWRLRVGDYRIIYDIYDTELVILIIKVSHRRDVYRSK